ncbi:MAG TPA: DUF5668 domain-containing protein [Herpetosiphonaceae bacterium]
MSERMHTTLLRSKPSNRTIAYVLIGVGVMIFIGTSGIFDGGVWDVLWPLAMIGVGLDLVTEGRHRRRVIAGTLIAAVAFVPVVGMAGLFGSDSPEAERAQDLRVVPLVEGMERLQVNVSGVDGQLSIRDKSGDRDEAVDLGRDNVSRTFDLRGDTGVLNIVGSSNSDENLELRFRRDLPLDLTIDSGIAEAASLDFEDLRLERLNLNVGNGDARLKLPEEGVIDATISSQLGGSIDLEIPDDLPARIEVNASASNLDIDEDRFRKDGNAYVSEDYNAEEGNRALILINATVGNVTVR